MESRGVVVGQSLKAAPRKQSRAREFKETMGIIIPEGGGRRRSHDKE